MGYTWSMATKRGYCWAFFIGFLPSFILWELHLTTEFSTPGDGALAFLLSLPGCIIFALSLLAYIHLDGPYLGEWMLNGIPLFICTINGLVYTAVYWFCNRTPKRRIRRAEFSPHPKLTPD